MNAERLHAVAADLKADLEGSNEVGILQRLVSALQNLVNQPTQTQYQQEISSTLKELEVASKASRFNDFSPSWRQTADELGATDLLGAALVKKVSEVFQQNQITPSVALAEMQELLQRLTTFAAAIDQVLASFRTLKVGREELAPGECELGVLIPRLFVENLLDRFSQELDELNRIFGVFEELATGSRPSFAIRTISSSELMVYLEVAAIVGACIATAIESIIELYKKLLEIRKLQGELVKQGVEKKSLKGLEEHANGIMESGIDAVVKELINEFKSPDAGRKNELSIELKYSLKKIANRVDRGFNFEIRMQEPEPAGDGIEESPENLALTASFERVKEAAPALQFLKLDGPPILSLSESRPDQRTEK